MSDRESRLDATRIRPEDDSADATETRAIRAEDTEKPDVQTVGRFEVASSLGSGAFGDVYLAKDPQLEREVALKVPRKGAFREEEEARRFMTEAKSAAALQHPNICPVHEVFEEDDRLVIVMGYIRGKRLDQFIEPGKPLAPRQAAKVVYKLAKALQFAHDRGIIHRDLKPTNIIIDADRKEPVIMDFGLARREDSTDSALTRSGDILGSPAYMSPEQARGRVSEIGPHSDIYSLGVILYELLCGDRPFGGSVAQVIGCIIHVDTPPPSSKHEGVDSDLEAICLKAMSKQKDDRYTSMQDFAKSLSAWMKQSGRETDDSQDEPVPPGETVPHADVSALTETVARPEPQQAPAVPDLQLPETQSLANRRRSKTGSLLPASPTARNTLLGSLGAAILLAVVLFSIRTPKGTVEITLSDPDADVTVEVDGNRIDLRADGKKYEFEVGDHKLKVTGDGFETVAQSFVVGAGENPVVKVALKPIESPVPPAPMNDEPNPEPSEPVAYGGIATGKWIDVPIDEQLIREKTGLEVKGEAVELRSDLRIPQINGVNAILRCRVNRLEAPRSFGLALRTTLHSESVWSTHLVSTWINNVDAAGFTSRYPGQKQRDLNERSRVVKLNPWSEVALAAIDDELQLFVDGKRINSAKCPHPIVPGCGGIWVNRAVIQVKDIQYMVLDRDVAQGRPGEVLWQDDFESEKLTAYSGTEAWKIEEGRLLPKAGSLKEHLTLPMPVVGDAVVEYSVIPVGSSVHDANFSLGKVYAVVGGNENKQSWINRVTADGTVDGGRCSFRIPKDREIRVRFMRLGTRVSLAVDDREIRKAEYSSLPSDPPTRMVVHRTSIGSGTAIDNLLIRRPKISEYVKAKVPVPAVWEDQEVSDSQSALDAETVREIAALESRVEPLRSRPATDAAVADVRRLLNGFRINHYGTEWATKSAELMSQLRWPTDDLGENDTDRSEFFAARFGQKAESFPELVGIIGSSRFKHWSGVTDVAFSPDGTQLITTSMDRTAVIRDPRTGAALRFLGPHPRGVLSCAVSSDGKFIATTCERDEKNADAAPIPDIMIWDATTGELQRSLSGGHLNSVGDVEWIPNSHRLVSIDSARSGKDSVHAAEYAVCVWDADSGELVVTHKCDGDVEPTGLAIHPQGQLVAVGTRSGQVQFREVGTLKLASVQPMESHGKSVNCVAFRGDGQLLASGGDDSRIRLIEMESGRVRQTLTTESRVNSVCFAGLSKLVSSRSGGANILWDLTDLDAPESRSLLQSDQSTSTTCVAVSVAEGLMAFGSYRAGITLTNLAGETTSDPVDGHDFNVSLAAMSLDGSVIATLDREGRNCTWSTESLEFLATRSTRPDAGPRGLAVNPRGDIVFDVRHWTGQPVDHFSSRNGKDVSFRFPISGFFAQTPAVSPDGHHVAIGTWKPGRVLAWNFRTGQQVLNLDHPGGNSVVMLVKYSPDGRTLSTNHYGARSIYLWNAETGDRKAVLTAHASQPDYIDWHPNGTRIVSSDNSKGGELKVWDTETHQALHELITDEIREAYGECRGGKFSPRGDMIAAQVQSGVLMFWDATSFESIGVMRFIPEQVAGRCVDFFFGPDGRHIFTANANGTLYVLRIPDRIWGTSE